MTVREALVATLRGIATDFDVFALMVLAALLYGVYYPAPYAHQHPVGVAIAVVDEEGSRLSRALVRRIDASEAVDVVVRAPDMNAARTLLLQRDVDGILLLPKGASRAALRAQLSGIGIWINGTHLTKAKGIGNAVQDAIAAELAGWTQIAGDGVARAVPLPARIEVQPMFNPDRGYAWYIFPAVTPVILQQTLLFGAAVMLVRRRQARGKGMDSVGEVVGTWLVLAVLSSILTACYLGWCFSVQEVPRHASPTVLLAICAALGMAIAAMAVAVGRWFRDVAGALLLLVPTSLPIFFLTGATWPREAMPATLAWLGGVFPATHGSRAIILADAMGASTQAVMRPVALLLLLTCAFLGWAMLSVMRPGAEPQHGVAADEGSGRKAASESHRN